MSKRDDQLHAIDQLRELLHPGDEVQCILRSVARSGMSREISFGVIKDGVFNDISYRVAKALDLRLGDKGVKVSGGGMDMGFSVVYALSHALFREFVCVGDKEGRHCPSNDHSNGDRNYQPHAHSDSGYALRHRWI